MARLNLTANIETTRSEAGTFFRLLSASGTIYARFTDQGQRFPLTKGMSVEIPSGFSDIVLETDTTQTIEYVVISEGKITDDALIPGNDALSTIEGARTYGASASVTLASAAATLIAAAASGRKQLIIYNPNASTTIYLHNSALTTLSAIGIPPGGALVLPSTQAWYGYNSSGAGIDVWKSEVT